MPKYPMYSRFVVILTMVLYTYIHNTYEKIFISEKNGTEQVIRTHLHPICQMITIHKTYEYDLTQI